MSPNSFIEIDPAFLSSIATDSDRIPTLYYSPRLSVRKFFWMRLRLLYRLIQRHSGGEGPCLDFGGGGGVFLPTLSGLFGEVVCVDLENCEAEQVIGQYGLTNVELVQGDVARVQMEKAPFRVIVAADVLEHFSDLSLPVSAIKRWLADDGMLYTSLPTENNIYLLLRFLFGITKPWDHYHTAKEVELYLMKQGFQKVAGLYVPLYLRLFPLFRISAWRLQPNE